MTISDAELYRRLGISQAELWDFCERSPITELAFFGSVLREDFREESDVDVLVQLTTNHSMSLMGFVGLEQQLEKLLKRKVDLVQRKMVEKDHNWIRRKAILNHAQVAYESRRSLSA